MLMGLQQRACSRCNQLPAPVDVFLIRLFTLHRVGWLQVVALGPSLGQWQEKLSTLCTPSAGDPCSAQPMAPTFQPPAQALSPCSSCGSVPSLLKGTSPPWGQESAVWAVPGLAKCPAGWRHLTHLPLFVFSKDGEAERGKAIGPCSLLRARWTLPALGIRNSGLSSSVRL